MAFQSLADKWALMITNSEVDDDILEHVGITRAEFDAMGAAPTWMDVVLNQAVGPWKIHGAAWSTLREFHMATSTRAVSHLKLVVSNIHRSTWALGGALLANAGLAVKAAAGFLDHLDATPPSARDKFEQVFCNERDLYLELTDFAKQPGPTKLQLWRGKGRWANLFRWLAPRLLTSPDHVLDCERQHAR